MWKKLWFAPYELKFKTMQGRRFGALLKVEFTDGKTGHADLHPYPEKGEADLKSHLEYLQKFAEHPKAVEENRNSLKNKNRERLCLRSVAIAREEALANGINLLSPLQIPLSHFLIWDLNACSPALIEKALLKGFRVFKIKLNHPLKAQSEKLLKLIKAFDNLQWRLDFCMNLNKSKWEEWKKAYLFRIPCLDFVEAPPVAFESSKGHNFYVTKKPTLAFDVWNGDSKLPVPVLVWKPARKSLPELFKKKAQNLFQKVVFTHCLSHPLDQLASAYFCAKFYKVHPCLSEVCGLTQTNVYEDFAFTLPDQGPVFPQLSGPGWGLDPRWLNNLPWKNLINSL